MWSISWSWIIFSVARPIHFLETICRSGPNFLALPCPAHSDLTPAGLLLPFSKIRNSRRDHYGMNWYYRMNLKLVSGQTAIDIGTLRCIHCTILSIWNVELLNVALDRFDPACWFFSLACLTESVFYAQPGMRATWPKWPMHRSGPNTLSDAQQTASNAVLCSSSTVFHFRVGVSTKNHHSEHIYIAPRVSANHRLMVAETRLSVHVYYMVLL